MNTHVLVYVVLLYFLVTAASCSNESKEEQVPGNSTAQNMDSLKEKENVMATLVAMWDAVEKGDIDQYASFVHPDFTQFGEYDSALRVGIEAEIIGMKKSMGKSNKVHTEMIDPRVTVNGDVAWIVYYWSDSGLTNGEPFATHGKSTRIFAKENDKWLCIHGHYTLLPVGKLIEVI